MRIKTLGAWVAYGIVAALLLLTHPFAPLVLGIQGIVMLVLAIRSAEPTWSRPVRLRDRRGARDRTGRALVHLGAFRWIPDLRDGKSYSLNPPAQADVELAPDLFKRTAEWLLGNSPRVTPLVVSS